MRGTIYLAAMLLALAGCTDPAEDSADSGSNGGGDTDDGATGNDGTTGGSPDDSDGGTSPPAGNGNETTPNAAPVIDAFEADVTAGDYPLQVTFAGNASDADGDGLSWSLDPGDGTGAAEGEGGIINGTHIYEADGTYEAVLTVSDGNLSVSSSIDIVVDIPADVEPPDLMCHADAGDYTAIPPAGPTLLYLADTSWIYEETNGVDGLQWSSEPSLLGENHSRGDGCENGDTVLI